MKMLVFAVALAVASPAAAQTAARSDGHAHHGVAHGQIHEDHSARAGASAATHAEHTTKGECCEGMDGDEMKACCEKMKAEGKKMACCEKKQSGSGADAHAGHGTDSK